jgi:hypothetical protein
MLNSDCWRNISISLIDLGDGGFERYGLVTSTIPQHSCN